MEYNPGFINSYIINYTYQLLYIIISYITTIHIVVVSTYHTMCSYSIIVYVILPYQDVIHYITMVLYCCIIICLY